MKHVTDKFGGFTRAKCSRALHGMAVGNLYKHGIYATCYIYVACDIVVNAKRRSLRKGCWEDNSDNAAAQEQVDRPLEARRHLQDGPLRLSLPCPRRQLGHSLGSSPFACDSCEHAKATCKVIRNQAAIPRAYAFGDEVHTGWDLRSAPVSRLGKSTISLFLTTS